MFTALPRSLIALLVIQAIATASFCYNAYSKSHWVARCQIRLDQSERIGTQLTELETQLATQDAALDAAEAQLNSAKSP